MAVCGTFQFQPSSDGAPFRGTLTLARLKAIWDHIGKACCLALLRTVFRTLVHGLDHWMLQLIQANRPMPSILTRASMCTKKRRYEAHEPWHWATVHMLSNKIGGKCSSIS